MTKLMGRLATGVGIIAMLFSLVQLKVWAGEMASVVNVENVQVAELAEETGYLSGEGEGSAVIKMNAGENIATGTLGRNNGLEWTYDYDTMTLTVTGEEESLEPFWTWTQNSPFYTISSGSLVEHIVMKDCKIVGDAGYLFAGLEYLESIEFERFDTSEITNMAYMFERCNNLEKIDISSFDTSKVTNMSTMFYSCSQLTSLDLSSWDTSKVTDMSYMFGGCESLTKCDLTLLNTSSVMSMEAMFVECKKLASIDTSKFNTSRVENMSYMFAGCVMLETLDLRGFNTTNVTDMSSMFHRCTNLASLDLSSFNTANVRDMRSMFKECKKIEILDLSNFSTPHLGWCDKMFADCESLRILDMCNFEIYNVTENLLVNSKSIEQFRTPKTIREGANVWMGYNCSLYDTRPEGWEWTSYVPENTILVGDPDNLENLCLKDKYIIKVVNSKGIAIEGAEVTYNDQTAYTSKRGEAFFDLFTAGKPKITIAKENYQAWESDANYEPSETNYETRILYLDGESAGNLTYAYCKGRDLLTTTKLLSLKQTGDFELKCAAVTPKYVREYQLWQGEKQIASCKSGVFALDAEKGFVKGGDCFIRVILTDNQKVDTPIHLRFATAVVNEVSSIKLMKEKLTFKVSDEIPFFGGSEIQIGFPELPVDISVTEEKLYIGFNTKIAESGDDSDEAIEEFYSELKATAEQCLNMGVLRDETMQKLFKKNVKSKQDLLLPGGKFKATIVGYAEADWESQTGKGQLIFKVSSSSPEFGFNTWFFVAPVKVAVQAEAEVDSFYKLTYDFETGKIDLNNNFDTYKSLTSNSYYKVLR